MMTRAYTQEDSVTIGKRDRLEVSVDPSDETTTILPAARARSLAELVKPAPEIHRWSRIDFALAGFLTGFLVSSTAWLAFVLHSGVLPK